MAYQRKTWGEKLNDNKGLPKVARVSGTMSQRWGTGTMVIPAPREVDELMRRVPKGKLTTINLIRSALAKKHGVNFACPITTGIFAWIAAHAAEEARSEGKKRITPWWRTLKGTGELNPKFPGGLPRQAALLEVEGHIIDNQPGKKRVRVRVAEGKLIAPKPRI